MKDKQRYGADLIVDSLINHNVKYVFGIPGAKIDRVFDILDHENKGKGPKMIVTRHEQGAALMAQAVGRLTGEPGVALVTSGPGVSNLATALVTATSEGDAVLAIGGQVKRADRLKRAHQSMDNVAMMQPATKFSVETLDPEVLSETVANAYRIAKQGRPGATFISVPQDVTDAPVEAKAIKPLSAPKMGNASIDDINYLAQAIKNAVLPVILVGAGGSDAKVAESLRNLLTHVSIPVVETFQGAGVISRDLEHTFFGRVGLFRNQPGDMLLKRADLVIAVGYDPIEYEARNWNAEIDSRIVVIDKQISEIDTYFQPERELIGDISSTLDSLLPAVRGYEVHDGSKEYLDGLKKLTQKPEFDISTPEEGRMHPLDLVKTFQSVVKDDETVTVDVGSLYIWMARYFKSYEPRHLLFSNGMQTLGVALPWAITAALLRPGKKVYSHSGDGGFLFTGQELETAVRLNLPIVHIIWNDGHYDMVKFQEEMKYGRSSAVDFGYVDYVKYAESMGAKGIRVHSKEELKEVLENIPDTTGPIMIDVSLDYSDNSKLADRLLLEEFY
ncbi:MAG: acetolactate synthase AlsS [Streptococcaceae bacterium]|jgi:acetolactate synthase-1/2/3 large subunit|nr:acetolactate synthase AlsS [Streptococcaceae bacterium]